MALTGMVPTIFGPGSGKFDNGIFVIQFVFKLAQKRTTWKIGLAWLPFLEDAIGVHVQDLLAVQFVEGLSVKMKACMDGGETAMKMFTCGCTAMASGTRSYTVSTISSLATRTARRLSSTFWSS